MGFIFIYTLYTDVLSIFYFWSRGAPENFDPKRGIFKNFYPKKGGRLKK